MIRNEQVTSIPVTPNDKHSFFGYYDLSVFSADDRYHLVHRVSFCDQLPQQEDIAEIGIIDMSDYSYKKVTETTAWNFQQGAMLQWHPAAPDTAIIYNTIQMN